jgi:hypothetical protein
MDLVVKGPLATEWMCQQAHWYLWAAEQEDELSHLNSQSPSLSQDYKEEVMSLSLSHQEVEVSDELSMPGEAEEYAEDVKSWGAVSAQGDTQEDWDAFYASQRTLYSGDHEEDGEVPDEAEEYVEDPTVLEEDDWATFQSWEALPDKAREQYAGPSQAAERGSSLPQQVWLDRLTWEQVGGVPLQVVAPSLFMAGQQAAWDSRPGVPMDTLAGRTRMRGGDTSAHTGQHIVCHHCHCYGRVNRMPDVGCVRVVCNYNNEGKHGRVVT